MTWDMCREIPVNWHWPMAWDGGGGTCKASPTHKFPIFIHPFPQNRHIKKNRCFLPSLIGASFEKSRICPWLKLTNLRHIKLPNNYCFQFTSIQTAQEGIFVSSPTKVFHKCYTRPVWVLWLEKETETVKMCFRSLYSLYLIINPSTSLSSFSIASTNRLYSCLSCDQG